MSRSRGSHIVNLMPLLDVLLCTMGTLIVILGVINREARFHPAKKTPGAVAQSKQKELTEAREDLQLRIEQVTTSREKTIADLEQSRVRLSGIEDHSRQLADQLRGLKATLDQFQSTAGSTSSEHDQLRLQLMQLNTQRMQLKSELEKTRAESKNRQPVYAVIPFEGMYRTNRRPIYIECRGDSIILQPEGLVFSPADFLGPGGPGNPLASALRAAQEYWRDAPRPAPDLPNEPYPLLLVRPDGIIAYYLARDAMTSWDAEFGYELVGADWKLAYPMQPVPQLKEMETRAVAEARQRMEQLAQISPELFSRKSGANKVQYHVSPFRGGVVRDGGPSLGNDPFADDPLGGFGRKSTSAGGMAGNNSGAMGGLNQGALGGGDRPPGATDPSGSVFGNSAFGGGGRNGAGLGSGGLGQNGPGGGIGTNGFSSTAGTGNNVFAGGSNVGGLGSGGYNGNGSASGANGNFATGPNQTNSPSASGLAPSEGPELASIGPRYAGPGGTGKSGGSNGSPGGDQRSGGNGNGSTASEYGGVLLPGNQGNASSDLQGLTGAPTGSTFSSSGAMAGSPGSERGSNGGGPTSGDSAASAGSASSSSMGQPGGGSGDPTASSAGGMPSMSFDLSKQYQDQQQQQDRQRSNSRSMADKRGKNWALPASNTASIGVQRPIRIECWTDRLVLLPDTRDQQPEVIPLGERTDESLDQLVGAVRTYTKTWGMAGRGMYWKPQLVLQVYPNADGRANDLQTLLAESGWDVKRR